MSTPERFWQKVNKTPTCWLWTGYTQDNGYGQAWLGKVRAMSHRMAWYLTHGSWPLDYLCHRCDVRACVNPDHLFVAKQPTNMIDMVRKGRCYNAKLSMEKAESIRAMRESGVPVMQIARAFRVHWKTIQRVLNGERWSPASHEACVAALRAPDATPGGSGEAGNG